MEAVLNGLGGLYGLIIYPISHKATRIKVHSSIICHAHALLLPKGSGIHTMSARKPRNSPWNL